MSRMRKISARVKGLLWRAQVEQEMDEEIRFHIQMRMQENLKLGLAPAAARREAEKRFGNMLRIKEACREIKGGGIVETVLQDIRFGLRLLGKNLAFSGVAALTLALGIGATTVIFSIVNAVVFRSLPFAHPEELVQPYWQWEKGHTPNVTNTQYAYWQEHSRSFADAAAYSGSGAGFNLAGIGEPVRVTGLRVSAGYFRVLGVNMAHGRAFLPEEDRVGAPMVAIISDGLWRRGFGSDPAVLGRQVELNGQPCTIVGILPPTFHLNVTYDLFVPLQPKIDVRDQGHNTAMIARLQPGITIAQAQMEMDRMLPQFRADVPNHIGPRERGMLLVPLQESFVGDIRDTLVMLLGAVGFVLLIACANVANLLLARAQHRGSEIAVRIALGAGRLRLVRQLLTESLILALAGGLLGLLIAYWSLPALLALSPGYLPRSSEITLDYQAVAFSGLISILTCLFFGVVPALQTTRVDVNRALKNSAARNAGQSGTRMRSLLVVAEVALSLVLFVGAALLIKSFTNLHAVQLGFDANNVTALQVSLNSKRYQTTAQTVQFQKQLLERIAALPGVVSVASVPSVPMERGLNYFVRAADQDANSGRSLECRAISNDYFRTLGIPLKNGRIFNDSDNGKNEPVAIVNEDLARRFWPDTDPIGKEILFDEKRVKIVGVIADIRERGLNLPVAPTFYIPMAQVPDGLTARMNGWFLTSFLVKTSGPLDLNVALRSAVKEVDPYLPVANIRELTEVVNSSVTVHRFITTLMSIFAALALALTAIGLYAVLSYQVSQRTQEIGIRMALGAQAIDVVSMILGQGMRLAVAGVVIGIVAAVALTRVISSMLFGVSATDPGTFTAISGLLLTIALIACMLPALRATRVEPITALKYE